MERVYTGYNTKDGEKIHEGDEVVSNCLTTTFRVEKADGSVKYAYRDKWVLMGIRSSIMWDLNEDSYIIKIIK